MVYVFMRNNSLRILWGSAMSRERVVARWESWRPLARSSKN